ncbi:MAG: oligosaccharide flippase family protein [Terracidiphilus sp.]
MNLTGRYEQIRTRVSGLLRGEALRAKAMRGGVWLGGGSVAEQATRLGRNMVLTRIMAPSAFGAMAIVMSSSAIVGALTEVGVRQAVIQNPRGREKEYLDAGWWLGLGRALITYLIIFAMAPLIAHFYGLADLSALLRVTLLGTLFDGAMSPRSALAQRDLKLGRWMVISNGGGICGVILTLVLSFVIRDVWALAIGFGSENAFRCILSYVLYPGLPSFKWHRDAVRDLYGFSKQAFGLSFLNLIFSRTDIFVLGKLYPAAALGVYSMGVALIVTPSTFLTSMFAQTLFPAFTHVQDDKERINRILIEVTSWLVLLGLPAVAVICLCGRSLLSVIYGARYVAASGPLAVAAAVVLLNLLNAAITCVFTAVGRPALHRRAVAASAVVMLIVIYPACKLLGMVGGQVAALLAIIVSYFLQVIRLRDLTGLDLLRYGRTVVPATLVSAGVLVAGYGFRLFGLATGPVANMTLGAGACIVAYGLCALAFIRRKHAVER